jgi:hypothetical protein
VEELAAQLAGILGGASKVCPLVAAFLFTLVGAFSPLLTVMPDAAGAGSDSLGGPGAGTPGKSTAGTHQVFDEMTTRKEGR